jgi:hypothetical protein
MENSGRRSIWKNFKKINGDADVFFRVTAKNMLSSLKSLQRLLNYADRTSCGAAPVGFT